MTKVENLVGNLTKAWALAGGVMIGLIMIVTSINVIGFGLDRVARLYGGSVSGLPGYEDFVRLGISCAALMFFPYCQLRRGHLAVDLFASALPLGIQKFLDRMWLVTIILVALFLAYWMVLGMVETIQDNALSRVLGWSEWPFYIPGIVSLVLWAFTGTIQLLMNNSDV